MSAASARLRAIDWLRGLAMILMAVDHASAIYNAGRVAEDNAAMYAAGSALPIDQFFTRWITHLCAPAFVLLAGMSIALADARHREPAAARAFDRHLIIRGLVLVALELGYLSLLAGGVIVQVLYALGVGMIVLVFVRRLGTRIVLLLAVVWLLVGEYVTALVWDPTAGADSGSPALALLLHYWKGGHVTILYPALPWLAIMMLGWVLGEHTARWHTGRARWSPTRVLVLVGVLALAVFVVVRGIDGYGNMFLHRDPANGSAALVQWLHVSKYPPSLAFVGLELGLVALLLALLTWIEPRMPTRVDSPVLVFGQTALFFYLIHWMFLGVPALAFGLFRRGDLGTAYLAAAAVLLVMYPLCRRYRAYKQAHPQAWTRYL